ncbi:MAG: hypothetical protein PHU23_14030, partial [Dehalococcoidales bacterium]|nr:hypothetical protein [Dehalococcoidales bacterium]
MSTISSSPASPSNYPATLSIDYPDRPLNRLTTFFRILMVIPIAIILGLITSAYLGWDGGQNTGGNVNWQ